MYYTLAAQCRPNLCETEVMPKRAIRIVKHIGSTPVIAACVACNQQFKAPTTAIRSVKEATDAIQKQFDAHECQMMDSAQNALRIERDATENK